MKNIKLIPGTIFLLIFCAGCQQPQSGPDKSADMVIPESNFNDYWYQGKAELTSYDLEQARYGEVHPGHAVLVFVTEDFSKKKQVKLDNPGRAGSDKVPVMKLNFTKKFNTGVYPYSMMQSIFSPINHKAHPFPLKTTMSSQEWCGHTFTQLNRIENGYHMKSLSYFEAEGDVEKDLPGAFMEDEVWSRIRIAPETLPVGEQKILPALFFSRLRHVPLKVEKATLTLEEKGEENIYTIDYLNLKRKLSIRFQKDFPHKIMGWEEHQISGFGGGTKTLVTRATLKKSIQSAYWMRNNLSDAGMRAELGLP